MSAPTLNEAMHYGSDFVRGIKMVESNKIALHVSGTASIDEVGRTAHPGDFDGQVERMLVNVKALLEGQGTGFGDVVSAVTYLKRATDAGRLRRRLGTLSVWTDGAMGYSCGGEDCREGARVSGEGAGSGSSLLTVL